MMDMMNMTSKDRMNKDIHMSIYCTYKDRMALELIESGVEKLMVIYRYTDK